MLDFGFRDSSEPGPVALDHKDKPSTALREIRMDLRVPLLPIALLAPRSLGQPLQTISPLSTADAGQWCPAPLQASGSKRLDDGDSSTKDLSTN